MPSKTYRTRDYYAQIFMQAIMPTDQRVVDLLVASDTLGRVIMYAYYQSYKEADKFLASIGKIK